MLFSSLTFLLYFMPLFFAVYFLLPKGWRNLFLLIASLIFYGFAEPVYILLIAGESIIGYIAGLLMDWVDRRKMAAPAARSNSAKTKSDGSREGGDGFNWRRMILIAAVLIYAGIFVYFKYSGFILENLSLLFGTKMPVWNVLLPLGISFYTFQIISYNVDVYRRSVPVQKSLIRFMTYVCMFPQLIAGPIVRYSTIEKELDTRKTSIEDIRAGLMRFTCGLGKKVLLANQLYGFCETFRSAGRISVLYCWLNALCILLYTYFDFSGYSDMAIGLGRMMGFTFPENFNYPFTASSITDFWRRWHMSLTTWFKDYIYIPLGGSRVPMPRHILNLLVVWLFTGLWHGADWTFIVWGLIFFVILVFEKFVLKRTRISHLYVWFILLLTFLLFNDPSLGQFCFDCKNLFGFGGLPVLNSLSLYALRCNLVLIVVCLIGSTSVLSRWWKNHMLEGWQSYVADLLCAGVLVLCLAYIVGGSFNPFLYFRF